MRMTKKSVLVMLVFLPWCAFCSSQRAVDPKWKIETFCGYQFGTYYTPQTGDRHVAERIIREESLDRPFRHFNKALLVYGSENKKLYHVAISFSLPFEWTYDMYKMELKTVHDILSQKYGIRFVVANSFGGYNYNVYCSNNDMFTSDEDSTYMQFGVARLGEKVRGGDFCIVVTRNDIRSENENMVDAKRRAEYKKLQEKRKKLIEKNMSGGGAEVL